MRHLPSTTDPDMIELVLLLRFGNIRGDKSHMPILNVTSVARLVRLSPTHVTRLIEIGCNKIFTSHQSDRRWWRNLNSHHLSFITDSTTLRKQAHLSLRERSILFHRHNPETFASASTIARIYKASKITFKKIKRGKRQIDFEDPHFQNMLSGIKKSLDDAFLSGSRVIFMDETLFSFNTYK